MDHFDQLVDFALQNPQINPIRNHRRVVQGVSREAMEALRRHDWPGNFRELEQALWRGVFAASGEGTEALQPRHLALPSGGAS
jgi:DNA-binding NtrC family response regulator